MAVRCLETNRIETHATLVGAANSSNIDGLGELAVSIFDIS